MSAVTIRDIARLAGVSTSTVSRAMNYDSGINRATRERILEIIKENNFVPNNSARNLKMTESDTIALLIKGIDNQFFQGMLHRFEEELSKEKYTFIIHAVGEDQDELNVAQELTKEKKLKGIIFLGGRIEDDGTRLNLLGIPCVVCTGAIPMGNKNPVCPTVSVDDVQSGYKVVDYLIKAGHKRIAVITSKRKDNSVGKLRLEGYKRALKDNGIEYDEKLVRFMDPELREYSMANGYRVTKELMEEGTPFTALFAISDTTAFGAYKAIYEAGKKIPEDYSVVGFDGLEMTNYFEPSLTTMKQPIDEMVRAAINELLSAIDGEKPRYKTTFEGELIERDSVKRI